MKSKTYAIIFMVALLLAIGLTIYDGKFPAARVLTDCLVEECGYQMEYHNIALHQITFHQAGSIALLAYNHEDIKAVSILMTQGVHIPHAFNALVYSYAALQRQNGKKVPSDIVLNNKIIRLIDVVAQGLKLNEVTKFVFDDLIVSGKQVNDNTFYITLQPQF
jgi:hypothetical protein